MKEIQKAIKHFESVRDGAVAVLDSGFGTKPNESDSLYKNRKLYSELAISALEKQIPKHFELWNGQCACPNCNKLFGSYSQLKTLIHWEMPYCKFCGQALDWSDHPTEKAEQVNEWLHSDIDDLIDMEYPTEKGGVQG